MTPTERDEIIRIARELRRLAEDIRHDCKNTRTISRLSRELKEEGKEEKWKLLIWGIFLLLRGIPYIG